MGTKTRLKDELVAFRAQFDRFTDLRQGSNSQYEMGSIGMTAFSVFFFQSPSFLSFQRSMALKHRRSNMETLFGVAQIPSDALVRDQLDEVSPEEVIPCYSYLFSQFEQKGLLEGFRSELGDFLLPLDGAWTIRSKKKCCDSCLSKTLSDNSIQYYHSVITPAIVAPGRSEVISLAPEVIVPQDGAQKQDCEINAAKRWLGRWASELAPLGITILGDDLYAHQPFCQAVLKAKLNFVLVCKPDSHKTLYQEVALFEEKGLLKTYEFNRGRGPKRLCYRIRYMEQLPLRDGKDPLLVNWFEVEVLNQQGERTYHNSFICSHPLSEQNLKHLLDAGRARWKVENENLNTLKNQGYNIEHNFGHGHKYLANTLLMLNILAFLLHTFMQLAHRQYRKLRQTLPNRKTFFSDIRALTRYIFFKSWGKLFNFMEQNLRFDSS